jgi:predicted DNA binding CopG/RHH family protein
MEEPMSNSKLPQTDSIQELAKFWDEHDLTEFEAELEEVAAPVFERETEVRIQLPSKEAETIQSIAKTQGIDVESLIREWVLEKVQSSA